MNVEAFQWTKEYQLKIEESELQKKPFNEKTPKFFKDALLLDKEVIGSIHLRQMMNNQFRLIINTAFGCSLPIDINDWVIKLSDGQITVCHPNLFKKKYERVE